MQDPVVDHSDPDFKAIRQIAAGDVRGCKDLMQRHLRPLRALASRLLGNAADADEVCQDAFVRAWKQAEDWRPGTARFSTWLHQVVLNLSRDRLRERREHAPAQVLETLSNDSNPEAASVSAHTARQVQSAVHELPERQRDALILVHFQEMNNIEAAAVMELSVDALESLLARGRRSLRLSLSTLYREPQ